MTGNLPAPGFPIMFFAGFTDTMLIWIIGKSYLALWWNERQVLICGYKRERAFDYTGLLFILEKYQERHICGRVKSDLLSTKTASKKKGNGFWAQEVRSNSPTYMTFLVFFGCIHQCYYISNAAAIFSIHNIFCIAYMVLTFTMYVLCIANSIYIVKVFADLCACRAVVHNNNNNHSASFHVQKLGSLYWDTP